MIDIASDNPPLHIACDSLNRGKKVLVTGSHRSGTTWVGTILAAHQNAEYIHEPLNVSDGPAPMRRVVQNSYTYICRRNESAILPALERVLAGGCQAEECRKRIRFTPGR